MRDVRYVTERPVGDYERCPRFVRVLLKRLIGDFIIYGKYYIMMRQLPIAHGQCDKGQKSKTRKFENKQL